MSLLKKVFDEKKVIFNDYTVVDKEDAHRYIVDCMKSVGTHEEHAHKLADVLLKGDTRGHYSHGLNRLEMYMKDIKSGVCKHSGNPIVLNDFGATAWVDGNNLLGPVVGNFCTDIAIEKAKNFGIGWVCAKGSNHYGIAGYYALKCMEEGLIGISMTNTSPLMFPTRAGKPALGTNPIAVAAGGIGNDGFVLDMATTTVAIGKVELAKRKNIEVPNTWGADNTGNISIEPEKIINGGGLLPLGGGEETGGYKGFGLASMVELFCGILSGGHWGPHVRRWMSTNAEADLGQCFVAINPKCFSPNFDGRVQDFVDTLRGLPKANEDGKPVEVAGDQERFQEAFVEKVKGIPYHPNQIENMYQIAKTYNVAPMKIVGKISDISF